ncbi:OLC1v1029975C3 [Oldenlandia corymbosa var. corymbosa]|uniref:OLC1v1029975C3 n=1 Tax=Oldenlandia corymbosa var. corymbosa TaxID=529605 RepID=A0AAV1CG00_OLDCO|nr:OLC1v1029975C3 [Oldenlandia corymbosa var. corymbosa]
MDETVDDDMTAAGLETRHIINKGLEFSMKASNSDAGDSRHFVTSSENNHNKDSTHFLSDILDGKNLDRIGSSEQASVSPRCVDNSGVMVEELTLRNYTGENLAIVGTSNNRERMQNKQNWVHNIYQSSRGLRIATSHGEVTNRGSSRAVSSVAENVEDLFFPGFWDQNQKHSCQNSDGIKDDMQANDDKNLPSNVFSSGVTRTKMLSKFGSSEYFIKNSLKGKGAIYKGSVNRRLGDLSGDKTGLKFGDAEKFVSSAPLSSRKDNVVMPITSGAAENPRICSNPHQDGVILRDWLKTGQNKVNKMENLRIFREIVKLVDLSHSQGVVLQDLHPSCFKLLPSNHIVYLGSSVRIGDPDNVFNHDFQQPENNQLDKRRLEQNLLPFDHHSAKRQKMGEGMGYAGRFPHSEFSFDVKSSVGYVSKADRHISNKYCDPMVEFMDQNRSNYPNLSDMQQLVSVSGSYILEENWYSSSEVLSGSRLAFSSNIYSLGVLLFELLSSFDSGRSHEAAMLDLRHRILPPDFLSENPKEAGFCLLLIHPDSSARPTTREILQSAVISGLQNLAGDELVSSIEEQEGESELLLYFLLSLEEQKQKDALKLAEEIRLIEADIEEVEKRRIGSLQRDNTSSVSEWPFTSDDKLARNIRQLENAYFSMRSRVQVPERNAGTRTRGDTEFLSVRENCFLGKDGVASETNDQLGGFYTDFCKYARYSKFRLRGVLRSGDLANSPNVICSLSFDRDEDYLAAGGVSKKIKIFDFQSLFDDSVDIHYPAVEMSNKSKLSCICWNSYIRNYLASTDYDGAVKLWDAATGQGFLDFTEHDERAWSVDFSRLDPKKFISGSDDRLVKLWSINEKNSLCTIRNNANVCCVQFSAASSNFVAFSSADYKTYCYDLRNISTPWCILAGHEKAVSYAKFLDSETLVSASTDNSLKIWDLKRTSSGGLSRDACALTLRGHSNEKVVTKPFFILNSFYH